MRIFLPSAVGLLVLVLSGVAGAQVAFRGYGDLSPGSLPAGYTGGTSGYQTPTGYGSVPTSGGYAYPSSKASSHLAASQFANPPLPSAGTTPAPAESLLPARLPL